MTTDTLRPRRRLGRLGVPLALLVLLAGWAVALAVHGTWADADVRDPASVAEGPVCRVVQVPGGGKEVRCALRLPFSMDRVWAVVTDYDNFGDICPYVQPARLTRE